MANNLDIERTVYNRHIGEWRVSQLGKFVLIKGKEIIGFYDSLEKAFDEGSVLFGMATFFIEQILPADSVNISFVGQIT